ncbi:hypothetical protein Poly51_39890 [Rubripirellula tenax]|uniref:Uncharacterized protein n=1 Tax=Rubripirellula tenax TaxID=2528015 RepID=A0A5C6ESY0_9BACT|nr:hypothetical protein Poly51_39890 [Rubripirellula tenax]
MRARVAKHGRCAEGLSVKTMLGDRPTQNQAGIMRNERLVVVGLLFVENRTNGFRIRNIRGNCEHPAIRGSHCSNNVDRGVVAIRCCATVPACGAHEKERVSISWASVKQVLSAAKVTPAV